MRSAFVMMKSVGDEENPMLAFACARSIIPDLKPHIIRFPRVEKKDPIFINRTDYTVPYEYGKTIDDVVDIDAIYQLIENYDNIEYILRNIPIPYFRDYFVDIRLYEDAIELFDNDVIFFSVFRYHLLYHMILAACIKRLNPKVTIVMGGPQVILSKWTQSLMARANFIDKVLVGDIEGILSYKKKEKVIYIKNEYKFATPEYGIYRKLFNNTVNLYSSRGCSMRCRYCPNGSSTIKMNFVPLADVESWVKKYQDVNIYFTDPYINFYAGRFTSLLHILKKYKTGYTMWLHSKSLQASHIEDLLTIQPKRLWMSYDIVDKELAKKMRRPTDEYIDEKIKMLTDGGINTVVPFIVGLPGETDETFQKTYNKVQELLYVMNDNLQIEIFPYLHNVGSPLFEEDWNYENGIPEEVMKNRIEKIKNIDIKKEC